MFGVKNKTPERRRQILFLTSKCQLGSDIIYNFEQVFVCWVSSFFWNYFVDFAHVLTLGKA